jgi:type II secretory pathway component PulF
LSQAQVFQTFNEQLACIAEAGVPMEEGLRLMAREVRSRRVRRAIAGVIGDLERGVDLSGAFEQHGAAFPDLYHQVMQVGVQTGRMSQVLILFGRHLAMVERLKRQIWQAMAYPLICLVMLMLVSIFLSLGPIRVLSDFKQMQIGWQRSPSGGPTLSEMLDFTHLLVPAAQVVPWICGGILLLLVCAGPAWWVLGRLRLQATFTDGVLARVPLLGKVLQRSALARWCDALYIATDAGLDLPQAIELAGKLVGWGRVQSDCVDMTATLRAGLTLRLPESHRWRLIPPSVRMALQLGSERNELPTAARTLGELYQREAESRAVALGAILSPLLLLAVAGLMMVTLAGLMSPIVKLFQSL